MNTTSADEHVFVESPHRTLIFLSFPVLLSLIAEPVTGLVDTAFIARLGSESLAALGVGTMALSSIFWIFNFLGIEPEAEDRNVMVVGALIVFFPMLSARAAFSRSARAPLGSSWAYVLFCVTTAIMYFYVAAWAASAGRPYWLPMACCVGYLVASLQDRIALPALKVAVPPLVLAPIAFHLVEPGDDWFSVYMIGVALIVFSPTSVLHSLGRALTRPVRTLFDEEAPEGLDERASRRDERAELAQNLDLVARQAQLFHRLADGGLQKGGVTGLPCAAGEAGTASDRGSAGYAGCIRWLSARWRRGTEHRRDRHQWRAGTCARPARRR